FALRLLVGNIFLAEEDGKTLPKDFLVGIAFETLRTGVPSENPALRVEHENCVILHFLHEEPEGFVIRLLELPRRCSRHVSPQIEVARTQWTNTAIVPLLEYAFCSPT